MFFTVVASGDYKLATLFKYKEREYLNRNEIADIGELSLALLLGSEYELLDSLSYDGSAKDEDK